MKRVALVYMRATQLFIGTGAIIWGFHSAKTGYHATKHAVDNVPLRAVTIVAYGLLGSICGGVLGAVWPISIPVTIGLMIEKKD